MRKFLVLLLLVFSCSGQTVQGRRDAAFNRSAKEISISVDDATVATQSLPKYRTVVRYNPAKCKCPPFEIFAFGRWMRVLFEGDPVAMELLTEFQQQERRTPSIRTFPVIGKFSKDLTASESRVLYPTFILGET